MIAVTAEGQARQEAARKGYQERGVVEGPGEPMLPGRPRPGQFDRTYLTEGHAADSPQHDARGAIRSR
ncbi:MAG: hypothetical protein ACYCVZ_00680 [Streptosporangiaceae bacterium]